MKITDISPQKKKTDRFNIYIDGDFAFGISAEILFENKLNIGSDISKAQIHRLIDQDQIERLFNKALRFLSYRPRSEKEIHDHLLWKGKLSELKSADEKNYYQTSVDKTLKKLKKLKLVDDLQFANWWIDQRKQFGQRPTKIIKNELLLKGIEKSIIEVLLNENTDEELALAKKLGVQKIKQLKSDGFREKKLKLNNFLLRRGFGWEIVKKTVDTLISKE